MQSWGSLSYAYGPLVSFAAIGVLALLLRWAFRRGSSVVASPARPGNADDYGLLVAVAQPAGRPDGEELKRRLESSGIRANLVSTREGLRVMVWPQDEARAKRLLADQL